MQNIWKSKNMKKNRYEKSKMKIDVFVYFRSLSHTHSEALGDDHYSVKLTQRLQNCFFSS
jgi:uncharacterized protein (DUF924 family)